MKKKVAYSMAVCLMITSTTLSAERLVLGVDKQLTGSYSVRSVVSTQFGDNSGTVTEDLDDGFGLNVGYEWVYKEDEYLGLRLRYVEVEDGSENIAIAGLQVTALVQNDFGYISSAFGLGVVDHELDVAGIVDFSNGTAFLAHVTGGAWVNESMAITLGWEYSFYARSYSLGTPGSVIADVSDDVFANHITLGVTMFLSERVQHEIEHEQPEPAEEQNKAPREHIDPATGLYKRHRSR